MKRRPDALNDTFEWQDPDRTEHVGIGHPRAMENRSTDLAHVIDVDTEADQHLARHAPVRIRRVVDARRRRATRLRDR
jgi:hypothetical protein